MDHENFQASQFIPPSIPQGESNGTNPQGEVRPPASPLYHPMISLFERYKVPFVIAAIVILISLISILFAAGNKPKPVPPPQVIQTTPTPTPTPIRELSPLATQSAFMNFEKSVASLSSSIQRVNIYDNALQPPVLDLELGFR